MSNRLYQQNSLLGRITCCINCCLVSSLYIRTKLCDNHTSLGDHEIISGRLITLTIIPVMRRLPPLTIERMNNQMTAIRSSNLRLQTRKVRKLGPSQAMFVYWKSAHTFELEIQQGPGKSKIKYLTQEWRTHIKKNLHLRG